MVRTTEEELFEGPIFYRTIVDAAEEGIWITDIDNIITFVNKKLTDILGYSRDEIIGKKIYGFTDEKNSAIMKEAIDRSLKSERDTYTVSIINKSGRFIPLLVATTRMQDEKGSHIGTIQLGSDMTVQKKMEDNLRDTKTKSDTYLNLLSHEISNMGEIAIGYLEMVMYKLDAGEHLTTTNRELIVIPLNALRSSLDLIDAVKSMQKVKTARLPMEKIDLGEVVAGVVNDSAQVRDRALKIHFSPVKDCWVEANYLLKEIFINLIGGALKHSNGPLDVFISIDEVTSDDVRYYAVTMEDNGPGIPDEMKSKLFSRLNCEEMKTHNKGLGLCLVKALVAIFHGNVRVEDRVPGDHTKGARFVVRLPAADN